MDNISQDPEEVLTPKFNPIHYTQFIKVPTSRDVSMYIPPIVDQVQ